MDLLHTDIKKLYLHYFIPALFSTFFVAFYIIGDTMMIGHGVGGDGLIALNILLPLYSLYYGFGYLYGVGGSVLYSSRNGSGRHDEANKAFSVTLMLAIVTSCILIMMGVFFLEPVCYFLGADASSITMCKQYGYILMCTAPVFLFSPMLQCFIRNDHNPRLAMISSTVGSLLNVMLDYYLIFHLHMGMEGAMIATASSSLIAIFISLTHFLIPNCSLSFSVHFFEWNDVALIYKNGINSFLSEITQGIVTFVFNMQILHYLSSQYIIVYSVIANLIMSMSCFINAVGSGAQPIISFNAGAKNNKRVHEVKKIGNILVIVIAIISYLIVFFQTNFCISLFVDLKTIPINYTEHAMKIYFLAIFAQGINMFSSSYFQSVSKVKESLIISLLRGFILCIFFVLILPSLFGGESIWYVMVISETITLIVSFYFQFQTNKKVQSYC